MAFRLNLRIDNVSLSVTSPALLTICVMAILLFAQIIHTSPLFQEGYPFAYDPWLNLFAGVVVLIVSALAALPLSVLKFIFFKELTFAQVYRGCMTVVLLHCIAYQIAYIYAKMTYFW